MTTPRYNSPGRRAWMRFKRNKSAIAGMAIIAFAITIAILGYLITPDSTPNANDQVLQIANEGTGFKVQMLERKKNRYVEQKNIFSKMLFGQENPYELIPITSYNFSGANIIVQEYTGPTAPPREREVHLTDVLFARSLNQGEITENGDQITFTDFDGNRVTESLAEMRQQVERENINTRNYYLGTDRFGRDNFSRLIIGVRISLSVGLIAVIISVIIGVMIGAMAGYFRGWIDDVLMWFINVIWSIPALLLVFAITLALGKGFWQIFIAVGLTMWVEVARIIRGQVLSLREMQFIEAAQSLGYNHFRTISIHILPNVVGPLSVIAAANFAAAIIVEAGLTYLGVGVQPPTPSWGGMLSENYGYIIGNSPMLAIIPGIAIMIMVLAFNLVGNGLRDAMDVRTVGK